MSDDLCTVSQTGTDKAAMSKTKAATNNTITITAKYSTAILHVDVLYYCMLGFF